MAWGHRSVYTESVSVTSNMSFIDYKKERKQLVGKNAVTLEDFEQAMSLVDQTFHAKQLDQSVDDSLEIVTKGFKKLNQTQSKLSGFAELYDLKFFNVKSRVVHLYYCPEPPVKTIRGVPWHMLKEERLRVYTYRTYPLRAVKSALLLAAEGFAYFGTGAPTDDTVICCFCTKSHFGWKQQDDIRCVHQSISPDCAMVTGVNCDNVPLTRLFDLGCPSVTYDNNSSQVGLK